MPCAVQAGPTINRYGQGPVRASLSAMRDSKKDFQMTGTFGLIGKNSLDSASLQELLESKLRLRSTGSILYRLTWKNRVTPLGRVIGALRASTARISVKDFILSGWPTTTTRDHKDGDCEGTVEINGLLGRQVWLAGWPTTTAQDYSRGNKESRPQDTGIPLSQQVILAGWPTTTTSNNGTGAGTQGREGGENLQTAVQLVGPMRLCSDGTLLTGSTAGMPSGGRLSPAHSRWLMRLPQEWDDCAPMETRSTRRQQRNSVPPSAKSLEYDL